MFVKLTRRIFLSCVLVICILTPVCICISVSTVFDCRHEIVREKSIHGNIVGVKEVHAFDDIFRVPAITIVHKSQAGGEETSFWIYNDTVNAYQFLQRIQPLSTRHAITGLEEIIRGHKRYFLASLSSVNKMNAVSHIPLPKLHLPGQGKGNPRPINLTDSSGKVSGAVVVEVAAVFNPISHKFSLDISIRHIVYADKLGSILVFSLETGSGFEQQCVLFVSMDGNTTEGKIFCFRPADNSGAGIADDNLYPSQNLALNTDPLMTSIRIESKTLLIIADNLGDGQSHSSVLNVVRIWSHDHIRQQNREQNQDKFVHEGGIKFPDIISIDSIVTIRKEDGGNEAFVAIASFATTFRDDENDVDQEGYYYASHSHIAEVVYIHIYKYDPHTKRLVIFQQIRENDVIQVKFQQLLPSLEIHLNILTLHYDGHNVIHIYTLKGIFGFTEECEETSLGVALLEPVTFQNAGIFAAQLITLIPGKEINVLDVAPNSL